jgi:hypothetical protein
MFELTPGNICSQAHHISAEVLALAGRFLAPDDPALAVSSNMLPSSSDAACTAK